MNHHQIIFFKIRELLYKRLDKGIEIREDENYLHVGESGIWISMDEDELTIGFGIDHSHYHRNYDDMKEAIDEFFNLLTRKTRITKYYKGEYQFKNMTEVEDVHGKFKKLSSSMTWLYPYWKQTRKEIAIVDGFFEYNELEKGILEIKGMVEN